MACVFMRCDIVGIGQCQWTVYVHVDTMYMYVTLSAPVVYRLVISRQGHLLHSKSSNDIMSFYDQWDSKGMSMSAQACDSTCGSAKRPLL